MFKPVFFKYFSIVCGILALIFAYINYHMEQNQDRVNDVRQAMIFVESTKNSTDVNVIEQRKIAQQQIKDFEAKENAEAKQMQFFKNQLEQSLATPKNRFLMAMFILSLVSGGVLIFHLLKMRAENE